MKKKVKLFSTIASLCLAVALMVFGVMAATSSSLGVSSTVSFDVGSHLNLEFEITVAYTDTYVEFDSTSITNTSGVYTAGTVNSENKAVTQTWKYTQGLSDDNLNLTGDKAVKLGAYSFKPGVSGVKNQTIVYTVKITNKGNYAATVTLSNVPTITETKASISVSSKVGDNDANTTAVPVDPKTGTYTLVTTYMLTDDTTSCSAVTYAPSFSIAAKTTA